MHVDSCYVDNHWNIMGEDKKEGEKNRREEGRGRKERGRIGEEKLKERGGRGR